MVRSTKASFGSTVVPFCFVKIGLWDANIQLSRTWIADFTINVRHISQKQFSSRAWFLRYVYSLGVVCHGRNTTYFKNQNSSRCTQPGSILHTRRTQGLKWPRTEMSGTVTALLSPWRWITSRSRLLLGVAAWHDFCVKTLLHFCKFHVNPNFDLELTLSSECQWTDVSSDIMSVWTYCQIFTHEWKTCLFKNYAIQSNGNVKPKTSPSLGARGAI